MREGFLTRALLFLLIHVSRFTYGNGQVRNEQPGDVRLVASANEASSGLLEYYINGEWGTVCRIREHEADVVCKQLGYRYSSQFGIASALGYPSGSPSQPIWLSGASCFPSAVHLLDCLLNHTQGICSHSEDVAINCTNVASPLRLVSVTGRTANLSAGRLEIFINNKWGTISINNPFSIYDANVACRQMGYEGGNAFNNASKLGYPIASASIPIWLGSLNCPLFSTLNDVRLCPHDGVGMHAMVHISHRDDVILSCTSSGSLRLVSQSRSETFLGNYGVLEIYWNGVWGTVCDNPEFSYAAASVACKQLGFAGAYRYGIAEELGYMLPDTSPILLDEVSCNNISTPTLLKCSHGRIGSTSSKFNCGHSKDDVGLNCSVSEDDISTTEPNNIAGAIIGSITWVFSGFGFVGCSGFWLIVCLIGAAVDSKRKRRNRHNPATLIPAPTVPLPSNTISGTASTPYPVQPKPYPVQPQSFPMVPPVNAASGSAAPYPVQSWPQHQQNDAYPPGATSGDVANNAYPPLDRTPGTEAPPSYEMALTYSSYSHPGTKSELKSE